MADRFGKHQIQLRLHALNLALVPLDDLLAVEPEELGIGAQEAKHVGGARQLFKGALFDRLEIGVPDAQDLGHGAQVLTVLLTRQAQGVGDAIAGREIRRAEPALAGFGQIFVVDQCQVLLLACRAR